MPIKDWRTIGVFGAALLVVGFFDPRLASWLMAALVVVVLVRNADKIAAGLGKVSG